ncbi:tRNA1(Val) (adenine(37)-N6)-methyltransferase [Aridibaculum aurantiacum]|uniref:tRNA1(Val) (adenine(37)-N6)-methyltransferase n=1 Tax=Aridibaculum aurantiacum TaxID=2810307 RepID=UPI001A978A6B|nr:methyltransferase [Aridibaculum aurantiacum]
MKVCTDACLFGAFVANEIVASPAASHVLPTSNLPLILDIGTGTGLLSLMLAQKTNAHIDAVEVNDLAAEQAAENIAASPFAKQVYVHNNSIQLFSEETQQQYDLVISNPPFFDNDLKSNDEGRNLALHSAALSLQELVSVVKKLLKPSGQFAVLLPYHRCKEFNDMASAAGFFCEKNVSVKQTKKHAPLRSMLLYTLSPTDVHHEEIIIKQEGNYSETFTQLLRDYYLYL